MGTGELTGLSVKRHLLRFKVGGWVLAVRDRIDLLSSAFRSDQSVGTLAQDQLATFLLVRLCRPGLTFVDVGAHIGSVTASVLRCSPASNVVACEAMPDKAKRLATLYPSVRVHSCGIGAAAGQAAFHVHRTQSGYSALNPPPDARSEEFSRIEIPVQTLDVLEPSSDVDVMKIDVEGGELAVLQGSEAMFARCRPVVMFESAPESHETMESGKRPLFEWFDRRGYDVLVPNRLAHDGPALDERGFVESHSYPRRTTNYFAVPRERRVEIRDLARRILSSRSRRVPVSV